MNKPNRPEIPSIAPGILTFSGFETAGSTTAGAEAFEIRFSSSANRWSALSWQEAHTANFLELGADRFFSIIVISGWEVAKLMSAED